MSEQLMALSNGKSISANQDALASTFLKKALALQLNKIERSNFYYGLSLMLKDSSIPSFVFQKEKTIALLCDIHKRLFTEMNALSLLAYSAMEDCPVNDKGLSFYHLVFHTLKGIKKLPKKLKGWYFVFHCLAAYKQPAGKIDFGLRYIDDFSMSELELVVRRVHYVEIQSISFILGRCRSTIPSVRILLNHLWLFSVPHNERKAVSYTHLTLPTILLV